MNEQCYMMLEVKVNSKLHLISLQTDEFGHIGQNGIS